MSDYLHTLARAHAERRNRLWPVQPPRIAVSWPTPRKKRGPKPYKFKRAIIRRIWADPAKRGKPVSGLTAQNIIEVVAQHYNVWPTSITAKIRTLKLVAPRHMAMYLCREMLASRSFPELSRHFHRHYTSCIHGCQLIAKRLPTDADLAAAHAAIRAVLFEIGDRA